MSTDHDWVSENRARRAGRCDGIGCSAPAVYLSLWDRSAIPRACLCSPCSVSPACVACVGAWRHNPAAALLAAMTRPSDWTPGDPWPLEGASR